MRPELAGINTSDRIEIEGVPGVHIAGSPEIAGGTATIAIAVNMIPRIFAADPGCYTPAELPVPTALLGGVHAEVRAAAEASRHV